jgi:RNA polymerase sigma-70 factor (ECF subfamily)
MARDQENYERCIKELLPRLNRYAFFVSGGNAELARDIVQEAVITGFQQHQKGVLVLGSTTAAWFTTVIRNNYLKHHMQARRAPIVPIENDEVLTVNGITEFEHVHQREVIQKGLQTLSLEHRQCVEMIDMGGFSYDEVAEIMGVPVGTVRSRLARARMKLAALLISLRDQ